MVEKFKLARKDKTRRFEKVSKEGATQDIIEKPVIRKKANNMMNETVEDWQPKTKLGLMVKNGEIKSLDDIFEKKMTILEPLIIDYYISDLKEKIVDTKKTSYVRMSGRKYSFRVSVLVGDGQKYVGVGTAKDRDKWNAVRKAARKARLNLVRVKKGSGTWDSNIESDNSIPKRVEGKCGSSRVILMPAPQGVGLVCAESVKSVFEFVGIRDIWSKSFGSTATTLNFVKATIEALSKTI